jgi:hypothetical protein
MSGEMRQNRHRHCCKPDSAGETTGEGERTGEKAKYPTPIKALRGRTGLFQLGDLNLDPQFDLRED